MGSLMRCHFCLSFSINMNPSCTVIYKTNEAHKYQTNEDETRPATIRFGDALGK